MTSVVEGLLVAPGSDRLRASATEDLLLRVVDARWEAQDVLSLGFASPVGVELPPWQPGAHLEIVLPSGLIRQYSLCGDPADRSGYRVAVLHERAGRGGSREVHDQQLVGRELVVRGPRNLFPLVDAAEHLFLAGGIGITPVLTMVRALRAAGSRPRLVYGGRRLASMAFLDELSALDIDLLVVPEDVAGRIDVGAEISGLRPGTAVYCCGPSGLIQSVQTACAERMPDGGLHIERFSAAPVVHDQSGAFQVELQRSGTVLTVPAGRSLLDVVREVDSSFPFSCEEGVCGTCEVPVVSGEVDHRDAILTPAEQAANDTMLICVSRCAGGRLVLDL